MSREYVPPRHLQYIGEGWVSELSAGKTAYPKPQKSQNQKIKKVNTLTRSRGKSVEFGVQSSGVSDFEVQGLKTEFLIVDF